MVKLKKHINLDIDTRIIAIQSQKEEQQQEEREPDHLKTLTAILGRCYDNGWVQKSLIIKFNHFIISS